MKITKRGSFYKLRNNPFDSHLGCHTYFHNYSRHLGQFKFMSLQQTSMQESLIATDIAKTNNFICYHHDHHLEYLKMLNDDKVSSVRFLNGNVWATLNNQEKKLVA